MKGRSAEIPPSPSCAGGRGPETGSLLRQLAPSRYVAGAARASDRGSGTEAAAVVVGKS